MMLLVFLIGVLCGVVVVIIKLGIKGDLVFHYVDGENKPYMCLELDEDVSEIEKHNVVVLRVRKKDHRAQK